MKTYKQIDACIQFIAIIAGLIFSLYQAGMANGDEQYSFIWSYFVVGGIQVISCISHMAFVDDQYKSTARRSYHITLLVIIISLLISFPTGMGLIIVLLALLFISPIIAVLYCGMCFNELKLFNHEKE